MSTKEHLLRELRKEDWVSGEALGEALGISRAAIGKQITSLRNEGYEIEASTKKGYRLLGVSRKVLPIEIQTGLKTRVLGRTLIEHHEQIDSTNLRAQQLANEGAAEGTVVVAEGQRLGRGRRGRAWHSPEGLGLYFSIILRPAIFPQDAPKLNLVAGVAVVRVLKRVNGVEAKLKWPNDVEIGGKKVAGILTSMVADMESIHNIVIGVGINVNGKTSDFPDDLRNTGTSVRMAVGKDQDRSAVMRAWLEEFEGLYDEFRLNGFGKILQEWRENSAMVGRTVRIDLVEGAVKGRVRDVDDDGYLVVVQEGGGERRIVSGDVAMVV